jgi:hypothetical protein
MTVRKQKPLHPSNRALVTFGLAICAGLIAIYSWRVHLRSQREEWAQEEIPVSEFRTVLTHVREGMRLDRCGLSSRGTRELRRWGKSLFSVASYPPTVRQQAISSTRDTQLEEKKPVVCIGIKNNLITHS